MCKSGGSSYLISSSTLFSYCSLVISYCFPTRSPTRSQVFNMPALSANVLSDRALATVSGNTVHSLPPWAYGLIVGAPLVCLVAGFLVVKAIRRRSSNVCTSLVCLDLRSLTDITPGLRYFGYRVPGPGPASQLIQVSANWI